LAVIVALVFTVLRWNTPVVGAVSPPVLASTPAPAPVEIPSLESLELRVKELTEKLPEMVKATQQMQVDILVLQGAIAREKQLTGKLVEKKEGD
jgi:hypothetical protein